MCNIQRETILRRNRNVLQPIGCAIDWLWRAQLACTDKSSATSARRDGYSTFNWLRCMSGSLNNTFIHVTAILP
eukprot:4979840-Amphidinium_carterae.1